MKVAVVPADKGGCGYYRLIWPAQAVSLVRPEWEVAVYEPSTVKAGFEQGTDRFIGVQGLEVPDILVMQRTGSMGQFHVARWAREQGAAVVIDFDDAMWCIDRDNYAWSSWNGGGDGKQHWRTCDAAAGEADLVTVTTESLSRHYGKKHARTEIIPNYIPQAALELPHAERDDDEFYAGWSGFTKTHPGDCAVSAPAAQAVKVAGGKICAITDPEGVAREWNVHVDKEIGPQRFGPSYYTALTNLDLMLVGLTDSPFNRSKSTLKVIEAAAAGAAAIAPDNPPHRLLQREGFPVTLASTPGEWAEAGKRFAADQSYAQDMRFQAAAAVLDYTIEGNAEQWATAWERAWRRRQLT